MSLPVELQGKQANVGGDLNIWGVKTNNIQQELADSINELYEIFINFRNLSEIDGGNAFSIYTIQQLIDGGNA